MEQIPLLTHTATATALPFREIPGSYGIPFISAISDRLDYFYNQGEEKFFQSRVDKYKSTVYRMNAPPGPFMAKNSKVIVLLDANSFPILFDVSKIEKKNVFTGTYMPSTSLTGGYRVCSYLDPSEPTHTKVKQLLFNLLTTRKSQVIPTFRTTFNTLFDKMEAEVASGGKSEFNTLNDKYAFEFLSKAYFGVSPADTTLGASGPTHATKWLLPQLSPIMSNLLPIPHFLEDLLLHTFPVPSFLVKSDYKALYAYFETAAKDALDNAEQKLGLSREEACHNILFATVFNSYGGFKVLFPGILQYLAKVDEKVHGRIALEVRTAVRSDGSLTVAAVEKMELVKSAVYEALRMDPPVKYQYGKAKQDIVIESHDSAFKVKKGEMLFGYQPFATRDAKVFGTDAGEYVADRFVGVEGKKLLKYVVWSNGPENVVPGVMDKQCAGKEFVVLAGRLLVAAFYLRYDSFTAEVGKLLVGAKVTVTSLTKATSLYSD